MLVNGTRGAIDFSSDILILSLQLRVLGSTAFGCLYLHLQFLCGASEGFEWGRVEIRQRLFKVDVAFFKDGDLVVDGAVLLLQNFKFGRLRG